MSYSMDCAVVRQDLERGHVSVIHAELPKLTEVRVARLFDEHRHLPLDLIHTRGPAEFKHIIKRRKRN